MKRLAEIELAAKPDLATTTWHEKITAELMLQRDRLTPAMGRILKIDLLQRLINRTAAFSAKCEECRKAQARLTEMAVALAYLTPAARKEIRAHQKVLRELAAQLTKTHKLVKPGQIVMSLLLFSFPLGNSLNRILDLNGFGYAVTSLGAIIIGLVVESVMRARGKML